ncbi:MAG: DNA polymerase/3'-5' exonuclease PolX [Candidatus Pacebacteria bacterium]|jgi:DNA polymerase (family 10)|nr:DNA polymerase/3'-5' exonuclease PolX [Candidatus Paceibacterota bacterium]
MVNHELARIFNEVAGFLDARRVAFKPFAYRRAAMVLDGLDEDAAEIYSRGGLKALEDIPGVGQSIAEKIEEYLKKGKIDYYEKLKRQLPVDLGEITSIQGLGPRRAKLLYRELGIRTIEDLEKKARAHKIAGLPGFGEKSESAILSGIEFHKHSVGRSLLGEMLPYAEELVARLKELSEIERVDIAGSLRRRKETIGDIDLLATLADGGGLAAKRVMDYFTSMPGVRKIWGKGDTKSSVALEGGFNADIRVLPQKTYGAALQYFTGSKEHNIALRRMAQEKNLKLSEYGLFAGKELVAGETEEGVYKYLGMQWIPPELREDSGEIAAALAGKLPRIIGYDGLRGDLHCHSDWDGGENSIIDIVRAAQKNGYSYAGIADHTKFLRIENGLDEAALQKRNVEIDKINDLLEKEGGGFLVLKGCEANIMPDGSIDIDDAALAKLDYVIAGVHSSMKMDKEKMTRRIITAIENKNVDIISHPTGRLLKRRDGYEIDFEAVCAAAARTGTALEVNSYPDRLDLDDQHIRYARSKGVKMVIDTDAHDIRHLKFARYGIAQARRGWAEPEDILNTLPAKELLGKLKKY